jgi:hypothetical protein
VPKKWQPVAAAVTGAVALGALAVPAAEATTNLGHRGSKVCHRHDHKLRGRFVHCVKDTRHARAVHRAKDHRTRVRYARRAAHRNAWVLPRYVVLCESGGNPTIANLTPAGIANGVPSGLYQITKPTWLGYGGGRFASEARYASVYEQGVIAKRVLASQGPRAWACW